MLSGSRMQDQNPSYEMALLKLGYLREDISSPWFSAAFSIPDFTPKEAFGAISFCRADSHSTL